MSITIRPICGAAILLSVIFPMLLSAAESVAPPIEILTLEYPPFMTGDGAGLGERIVGTAFQTQGYAVKFLNYPRKRTVVNFQDGEGQLLLGTRESLSEQDVEAEKILYLRGGFVYLKKQFPDFHLEHLDALKGKTIGMALGSSQAAVFREAGLTVEESTTVENNLKKLSAERIDVFYTLDVAAFVLMENIFPEQVADFGFLEYKRYPMDLIARKDRTGENLLQVYRTGLKMIIENGTYNKIMEDFYGVGRVPESVKIPSAEIK